jgi:hypothetical protein
MGDVQTTSRSRHSPSCAADEAIPSASHGGSSPPCRGSASATIRCVSSWATTERSSLWP